MVGENQPRQVHWPPHMLLEAQKPLPTHIQTNAPYLVWSQKHTNKYINSIKRILRVVWVENTNTFSSASTPKELLITKSGAPGILLPPPQAPGSGKLCPQGPLTPTGDLQAFSLSCSCFQTVSPHLNQPPGLETRTPVWHDYCHGTPWTRPRVVHGFSKKRYTYSALSALREI